MNNFYFYRSRTARTHTFIAWDEDNAFLAPDFGITTRLDENVLTRKTLELREFPLAVFQRALGGGLVRRRTGCARRCSGSSI